MTSVPPLSAARLQPRRLPLQWLPVLLALAGCGGTVDPVSPGADPVRSAARADAAVVTVVSGFAAPLLDDDGHPMPPDPAALPADPAALTRSGARHASAAQAAALAVALPGGVLTVTVDGAGVEAEDQAVAAGHEAQLAHERGHEAPVLVVGADARAVARVADRLAPSHAQVWAVGAGEAR
jgi:hypothetical protein